MDTEQQGYRGVGMEDINNPRLEAAKRVGQQAPDPIPAVDSDGPRASEVYRNVQVLGDLSVQEFTRLMQAITQWVAPEEGCAYCHQADDLAADQPYTKVVSRHMLKMTRHINDNLGEHVGKTGVTCYTCHRGKPVPEHVWYTDPGPATARGAAGNKAGQNTPAHAVGLTSLPYDPFSQFLINGADIRVQPREALPAGGSDKDIMGTEKTYALMMHMSQSLGENCTFCHNSRVFMDWEQSSPARVTAWHGINAVSELNSEYLEPLGDIVPASRKGPLGDPYKANCATCHQGIAKPLYGVSMLKDYPSLGGGSSE